MVTALPLIDPGPAQRAQVTRAAEFPLAGMLVIVAEVEGTVQLVFASEGWPDAADGRRKVMSNVFADRATPAELRALADHLDGLALDDPMEAPHG